MLTTFVEIAVGWFLIWFIANMRIFDYIFVGRFLVELRRCDICLGFWVYLALYTGFQIGILDGYRQTLLVHILNPIITSAILSVGTFLLKRGWNSAFGVTIAH